MSPAIAVRLEEIYFYENNKWRSYKTKIAGCFYLSYEKVWRMYYYAPPMTRDSKLIELICFV